jgi:hypothetical protein
MKLKIITVLFFSFLSIFGQNEKAGLRTEEIEIESGMIIKTFENEKLQSFNVVMYAVNYGNQLSFTKENDTIVITNAQEKDAVIKIYVKNSQKISTLFYKGKLLSSVEAIHFDVNNLPAKSVITSIIKEGEEVSFISSTNNETGEGDYDKTFKLLVFLETAYNNVTVDLIFNQIADFFSKEDALLRIYFSKYRDEIHSKSEINYTAYLQTNELGKIKNGIAWTALLSKEGEYSVYKNGTIIKSEKIKLDAFQKVFTTYRQSDNF